MSGFTNTIRCPVCNKFGSPALGGLCKIHAPLREKLEAEKKCAIETCNEWVHEVSGVPARYCKKHLYGDKEPNMVRKTFDEPANSPLQGWRQKVPENFRIVSKDFPIEKERL
jgi:hypothetical protein